MTDESILTKLFKNQAALALVISGGDTITTAARIKANRIWHGLRKPSQEELSLICDATNGAIDANYFYGIKPTKKVKKSKSLK